ncbi:MAG TPA: DUF1963 domain-containing protein [Planctomycetota bacterium]|nr:DUF1963 domain-containing protein [Planctomycetota bacterium]
MTSSKFAGNPWIGPQAPWPECALCKTPLQLFLQLNLAELPESLGAAFGTGLLQLFYCIREECAGLGGWAPFEDKLSRVRVVQPTTAGLGSDVPGGRGSFLGKRIVGWKQFTDLPEPGEHESLGLRYSYDFNAGTVRLECKELGLLFDEVQDEEIAEKVGDCASGDKLHGWPKWVQGVEYPTCPRCRRTMRFVFQIDSEDNVPFMFGDMGRGHITQCPEHKGVVAFEWACS